MVGFILTGHGSFAPGLASALAMVAGDQPEFEVRPFDEAKAGTYGQELHDAIDRMSERTEGVLVFVDLLGGTPFNQAMLATQGAGDVRVVAGCNLPMLIETLFARNADEAKTLDELVDLALATGQAGVVSKRLDAAAASAEDDAPADDEEGL